MGVVAVEGMEFYSYHGFYAEEQLIGTNYIVDVYVRQDNKKAAKMDDIKWTVNYETIYRVVKREMAVNSKLIEHVADRILQRLKFQFYAIQGVLIRIKKLNPPMGGPVKNSFVELEDNFVKKCTNCKKPLICYRDDKCWCNEMDILDGVISQKFGNCSCSTCVS